MTPVGCSGQFEALFNRNFPMTDMIHFEDLAPGTRFPLGPKEVTREEVVAFAAEFDPQPFHLDETAGKASVLGGLAASGWHSCAMMMRMIWDSHLHKVASEGSPGIEYLKWKRPVLIGDTLTGETRVDELRRSKSRATLGIVTFVNVLKNQRGEVVLESRHPALIRVRNAGEAA